MGSKRDETKRSLAEKLKTNGGTITKEGAYCFISDCCLDHIHNTRIFDMESFRELEYHKMYVVQTRCKTCNSGFHVILSEDNIEELRWNITGIVRDSLSISYLHVNKAMYRKAT